MFSKKIAIPGACFFMLIFWIGLVWAHENAPAGKTKKTRKPQAIGFVKIFSMTDGVKIHIDGELMGTTPLAKPISLRSGKHLLKATKAGYKTFQIDFFVKRNRTIELQADLLPHSGLVKFSSNPKNAKVYLDDKYVGHTPLIQDIMVGDHVVLIEKNGYSVFSASINVKAGEKIFVEGNLTPLAGIFIEGQAALVGNKIQDQAQQQLLAEKTSQVDSSRTWYSELHKQWWFWTLTAAVVTTAVTLPFVLGKDTPQGLGDHNPAWQSHLP